VVVTAWTDAPISWPPALPVGAMGHPTILVNQELARAVRHESAAAIHFWWGVSVGVVHRWRKALGVTRTNNGGSQRLIRAASAKGADATRGITLPEEQVERRRRTALEQDLGRYLVPGYHGPWWSRQELALLGKLPDDEVARRTGRTWNAVWLKRGELGIPNPQHRRRR
jgi:hypothetical protein